MGWGNNVENSIRLAVNFLEEARKETDLKKALGFAVKARQAVENIVADLKKR